MIELSKERLEQILHEETAKKEELETILRSIYTRYMRLYERYFEDIDALNDEKIAELKKYHEETGSLFRAFFLDIPQDVCTGLREFENQYNSKLLGSEWHELLFDAFEEFQEENRSKNFSEKDLKAEFQKEILAAFYDTMDFIFRDGFGTGSQVTKTFLSKLKGLLFEGE